MVQIHSGKLIGEVSPPTSKSISHRALILSSFIQGSKVTNLLRAEDTLATKSCLEEFGVRFSENGHTLTVERPLPEEISTELNLDCKNSGTTLRLLMGLSASYNSPINLFGDDSLNKRPISPLSEALKSLGVSILTDLPTPPVKLQGPVDPHKTNIEITGKMSSQFISSLLILAAKQSKEFTVNIQPPIVSQPYISLTCEMLNDIGVKILSDQNSYTIHPSSFQQHHFIVPVDFSSAAFFIAAGAIPGNQITIDGYFGQYSQADQHILSIVNTMGAKIEQKQSENHTLYKIHGTELVGRKINIAESPDLFPILSVIATQAEGETILHGAHHLIYKETNRIEKMTQVIKTLGGEITPTDDGAIIKRSKLKGGTSVNSFGDHRIAMAAAIAGTFCEKPIEIQNASSANVSYPTFFEDLNRLLSD